MINNGKNKRRKKTGRRGIRYWIVATTAMGVLVAYTVGGDHRLNKAFAAKKTETATLVDRQNLRFVAGERRDEGETTRRFDIPPGTLQEVLSQYEKVTGITVVVPSSEISDISSKGVVGVYTDEQALIKILEGTGVTYSFTGAKGVSLRILGPNETVEVVGQEGVVSSPKYTEPLRNVPQTVTVIKKEVIQQQGATTLRDVLRNVTGLTVTAGEGGVPAGDNLTLRGFSARNDIYIDGARDLGPQTRDPFNVEQVEVVKGPSSTFSGRGSTGGTINLISKTPGFKPLYNFDLTLGTDETRRVTGDVNLPLDRLGWGERTAFRLNAMVHDSSFAGREVIENDRWGIAPTLTFGLGQKSSMTLGYFHLQQNNISDYGIPWVPNTNNALVAYRDRPAPVPRETFYGYKDRDKEKLKADLATLAFNHAFSDKMNLRNQFRYGFSTRDSIATPPRFASNNSTVINREMRSWITEDETWDNQTDFTARFNTGGIEHSFVSGVEFIRENNIRILRSAPNATTTLLDPNPFDVYTGAFTISPFVGDITADTQSFYAFDTVKLHRRFEISGGLRWDRFSAKGVSAATTGLTSLERVDKMLSYRLGAVYKPASFGSFYVSYGTSLNPSLEGLSYQTSSAAVEPEKTYSLEAGTKWELFSNRLLLSGAVFRVDKDNARTPGLPGEPAIVLDGRQRVDGFELSASGNFTRNWNVVAGYTFLDSEVVASNTAPTIVNGVSISEVGKELINTPRNSFTLWSTYQLPFGLSFGGGARFVDKRYGNNINTRFVDSYWLIDATASYRINKYVDLRLNLNNLTDKYYFDRITGGQVVPGAARSVLFSTNFHF